MAAALLPWAVVAVLLHPWFALVFSPARSWLCQLRRCSHREKGGSLCSPIFGGWGEPAFRGNIPYLGPLQPSQPPSNTTKKWVEAIRVGPNPPTKHTVKDLVWQIVVDLLTRCFPMGRISRENGPRRPCGIHRV